MLQAAPYEKIQFSTKDDVRIIGNYYTALQPAGAVLMLHMMPATKESWDPLALQLQDANVSSLAIDLRGHGESVKKGKETIDYQMFSDEDHQASRFDVDAALSWLTEKTGLPLAKITVVGASVGANLALEALARYEELCKAVALSPGLNYRGLVPKPLVQGLNPDKSILYATAQDDDDNAAMTQELYDATVCKKELKLYVSGGHGTTLLEKAENLSIFIIEFIAK